MASTMAKPAANLRNARLALVCACISIMFVPVAHAAGREELLQRKVERLERELAETRAELAAAQQEKQTAQAESAAARKELADSNAPIEFEVAGGTLRVGGAMRVNYAVGDYPESSGANTGAATRASDDGGNFALDTYRVNLDYKRGKLTGKVEYRWYNGYNFLHTGWLGWNLDEETQVQVGVNRVPFGPGPYGVSQSWLFDQHYYVGLADDMDAGVKYSTGRGDVRLDFAYYYADEGSYTGATHDSARYSYDVVNESGNGYEERNQFNARAIYHFETGAMKNDLGLSLQFGELESTGPQGDGNHYAISAHMVSKWDQFTLAGQLTRYEYDVSAAQPLGTNDLVQTGAYDFPSTLAAQAWLPAVSLSYYLATPELSWLEYVIPYIEYSSLIKDADGFNDSDLAIIGAAFGRGGWYIYADYAWSNGNEFVGGDTPFGNRLGANPVDDWVSRFNINFGYYF